MLNSLVLVKRKNLGGKRKCESNTFLTSAMTTQNSSTAATPANGPLENFNFELKINNKYSKARDEAVGLAKDSLSAF